MTQTSLPLLTTVKNQKGQGVVEMVLLLAIVISISMLISNQLQKKKFIQNLVGKPWEKLSGMIECGVWTGCAPGRHPNSINRNLSYKPDQ